MGEGVGGGGENTTRGDSSTLDFDLAQLAGYKNDNLRCFFSGYLNQSVDLLVNSCGLTSKAFN